MELVTEPTVISIDPGGTTGWSVMRVHPEALVDREVPILTNITRHDHGQIRAIPVLANPRHKPKARELSTEERRCVRTLMQDVVLAWPGAVVVIEDFILRKQSMDRELLSPVRLTAALEWAIDESGIPYHLDRQTPSEAKGGATDDRLRKWGLYKRAGGLEHARDADRHSIVFLRIEKGSGIGLAWPHLYNIDGSLKQLIAA
jgi:hypothetical protein